MADNNALNPDDFRKIGEESISILNSIEDISKVITTSAKNLSQATQDSVASFGTSFNAAKKLGKELAGISANDLKDRNFKKKLDRQVLAAEKELLANKRKQRELALRAKTARGKEKALLEALVEDYSEANRAAQSQLDSTRALYKELKRIDNDVEIFDDIADIVGDIPVLNKVFKDFAAASKKAREASADGKASFKEAAGEYTKAAGKALQIFAVGKVYKGLMLGNELTTEFARNLNQSVQAARETRDQVLQLSIATQGLSSARDYADILNQVSEKFGVSTSLSNSQLKTLGLITKELGLSGEAAQSLLKYTTLTGKELESETKAIIGQTLLANDRNKVNIRYQDILKDISSASSATLLTLQKFPGEVQKAAFETRKFGLSLSTVSKIGEGLLDFESSISAELEAELLTGKQLNLERARMAALTGDTATLAKEISANFGSAAEFQDMNVIAQNAFAKSLGMTRDELADVYAQQAAINKLSNIEGATLDDKVKTQQREIKALREKGDLVNANKLEQKLINDLGDTELGRQLANKSAAEATRRAMESIAEAAGTLSTVLEPVANLITSMGKGADFLLRLFLKIKAGIQGIKQLLKGNFGIFGSAGGKVATATMKETGAKVSGAAAQSAVAKGTATATKVIGKQAGKQGFKQIAKRIPILGSLVGVGFGIDRLMKGDTRGALYEFGSAGLGLLDLLVPGLGTGLSLAADAGIVARDVKLAKEKEKANVKAEPQLASGGIITQPTRALVGEAGAEAVIPLREFYAKMDEMIQATREGKIINLDGRKVNDVQRLSYSKLQ